MPVKQVIVINTALNMRKGKMVAQGSHSSVNGILSNAIQSEDDDHLIFTLKIPKGSQLAEWLTDGRHAKIVVGVNSEEELLSIYQQATESGLNAYLVTDMGLTEFHGNPTKTCLSIGPDDAEKIDEITGHLKLL